MTSLAMPVAGPDHGAFRWGLCFAVVAAAHVAAAVALLNSPQLADSGFLAGAAVVMIDLPQAPASAPAPAFDLPRGPELVVPVEQTPPLKEETKPPEQMAEVALQEPEPPKPQPPVEAMAPPPSVAIAVPDEKPAAAGVEQPQQPRPSSVAVSRWQSRLSALITNMTRYPSEARARGEQGRVELTIRVDRAGRVRERHIQKSSGWSDLDQEVLSVVARARLPKPPPDAKDDDNDLYMTFPVNFLIDK
jgi:TonB family protein